MKTIIQTFINISDAINIYIGKAVSWLFIPLMMLSVYEVFTRRILGSPTIWTYETTRFVFVPIIILALAYTQLHRGHASIDLFYEKFKPRTKRIVDTVTLALFLGVSSVVMFLNSFKGAQMSWASLERTPSAFNAPIYPIKTLLPIGFALLFLAGLSMFLKNIYALITDEPIESDIVKKLKSRGEMKE